MTIATQNLATQDFLKCRKTYLSLLLAALSSTILSSCNPKDVVKTPEALLEDVAAEEIYGEIVNSVGETVVVRSKISEIVGETSFLLEDNQFFSDNNILVIDVSDDPLGLSEDDEPEVLVVGEVQQLVIADFESTYGLALDPVLYAQYDTLPVIIARGVELSPDPAEITANPHLFYNQRIALVGEVEEKLSPTAVVIDEDGLFYGEDLLVVTQGVDMDVQENEAIAFTGILRPYIEKEFDTYYDLEWDLELKERINTDYVEKPVFVAEKIYPSKP